MHPAAVVASSVLAAASSPAHRAAPFMPVAPNVRYAHTAPPVNGTDNQLPAAAAYYPGEDTVYFGGNLDRFTRGHELGHAFDDQVLSDADRGNMMRLMRMKGAWNQGTGLSGGAQSPSEIFADWYGNAAIGNDPRRKWSDAYATPPSPPQFRRFQLALARIGRQRNLPQYTSKP
jgi:hypothetical protein